MSDARLTDLLLRWEELHDRGVAASVEELCRDCPELAEPLRQRIEILRDMEAVLDDARHEEPPPQATKPAGATVPDGGRESLTMPEVPGYQVLGELGRGGMGVVYRARQVKANRVVALKMILSGGHAAAGDLARFHREIETVASVQHPNLVAVYEVGECEGRPFFSMEYVEGGSLADWTHGKPQHPREAAQLVETLARAMHVVHQHGIVHRDLKPANILLQRTEDRGQRTEDRGQTRPGALSSVLCAKISDFGLARKLDASDGMTMTGSIVGTPSYMAPEQAAGKKHDISPATDVWALGAILYELLVGRPPFLADTGWDTILQVAHEEPVPPTRLQPKLPRDLETICLKCLNKDPARRYASALDLADDLHRFLDGEPIRARPSGPLERAVKWARRRPAVAALLGVSVLAGVLLVAVLTVTGILLRQGLQESQRHAEERRQALVRLHVAEGGRLLDEGDWFRALVWFAEALREDEGQPGERDHRTRLGVALRQCPPLVVVLFHDGPVGNARFSRDGRLLVTASDDDTARVWDAATGRLLQTLRHGNDVSDAVFSPDGRTVATASDDGTAGLWDVATGKKKASLEHGKPLTSVSFDATGERVLTAGEDGTARVWDAATGKQLQVFRHDGPVRSAEFSPDGKRVLTGGDDKVARVWDARTGEPELGPLVSDGPVLDVSFRPKDGGLIVTSSADGSARSWDASTGKRLQTLQHRGRVMQADFNHAGNLVSVTSEDHTVSLWNPETGEVFAETLRHRSAVGAAVFSPDDRFVVSASEDNAARVWDSVYGEALTPLLRHNGSVTGVCFSPDGRFLVTAGNDHTARVWDLAAASLVPPTPQAGYATPAGSQRTKRWPGPDGRAAMLEDDLTVRVVETPTDRPLGKPLGHGSQVTHVAFSRDGGRLVSSSDDNTARIWDWAAGSLLTAPLGHTGSVRFADFSPDGGRVVTWCADGTIRVWDAANGGLLTPPLRYSSVVTSAEFDADGQRLTVKGPSAVPPRSWDLSPDPRPVAELQQIAQMFAGGRIDKDRGLLPLEPGALRALWEAHSSHRAAGTETPRK